ncbi:hypothetical protein ATE67_13885 [Sphingopyxis sp. H050]|jgi:hypothetical protein|uniref:hypothetical protein n=1 Tax=Sphingopyxis sp. H050 TaxID=1759072 RepID=UPI0007376254|nr:hypothetical protein [Sphingopyxis sp. H050]KTE19730.1 hypothetical protein ATE67_13885 [Sphingopyxis sp. H050]
MSAAQTKLAALAGLLFSGAGQAAFATGEMLEHARELVEVLGTDPTQKAHRFSNETIELLADALQSAIGFELEAIDAAMLDDRASHHQHLLEEESEKLNQLLGAVTRFLDGWTG